MDNTPSLSLDLATAAIRPAEHGSKAANIARLARLAPRLGFSVPLGFVLPQSVLDALWRALGLEPSAAHDLYSAIIERCDVDLARAWQQRIHLVDLPEAISVPLQCAYDELVERTGGHAVVVRSSFHAEDRAGRSCAGIFESVRNVAGAGMLAERCGPSTAACSRSERSATCTPRRARSSPACRSSCSRC